MSDRFAVASIIAVGLPLHVSRFSFKEERGR